MQIRPVMFNAGLQGMQRANQGIGRAASEIVQQSALPGPRGASELAAPLVALKTNTLLFQASGKILAMENENAGHLIDVLV